MNWAEACNFVCYNHECNPPERLTPLSAILMICRTLNKVQFEIDKATQ